MEWYWWVLIAVGVAAFVVVKTKVSGSFLRRMKEKQEQREKNMEDDE